LTNRHLSKYVLEFVLFFYFSDWRCFCQPFLHSFDDLSEFFLNGL